LNTEEL